MEENQYALLIRKSRTLLHHFQGRFSCSQRKRWVSFFEIPFSNILLAGGIKSLWLTAAPQAQAPAVGRIARLERVSSCGASALAARVDVVHVPAFALQLLDVRRLAGPAAPSQDRL